MPSFPLCICSSLMILIVGLFRKLPKRWMPRKAVVWLWLIIALRMLVPWDASVKLPVRCGVAYCTQQIERVLQPLWTDVLDNETEEKIKNDSAPVGTQKGADRLITPEEDKSGTSDKEIVISVSGRKEMTFEKWIPLFWFFGTVCAALILWYRGRPENVVLREAIPLTPDECRQIIDYIHLANQKKLPLSRFGFTRKGTPLRPLLVSDRINTPVTVGIFRQKIILSKTMTSEEPAQLAYVLLHEVQHVRGYDNLVKLLVLAAVCVHWFNPLAWHMFSLLSQDIEMACDDSVLRLIGESQKKNYANSILLLATKKSDFQAAQSGFVKNSFKKRFVAIIEYRDNSKGMMLGFLIILCVLMTSFVQADITQKDKKETTIEESKDQKKENRTEKVTDAESLKDDEKNETVSIQWLRKICFKNNGDFVSEERRSFNKEKKIETHTIRYAANSPKTKQTIYQLNGNGNRMTGISYYEDGTPTGVQYHYLYVNSELPKEIRSEFGTSTLIETFRYDKYGNEVYRETKKLDAGLLSKRTTQNYYNHDTGLLMESKSVLKFYPADITMDIEMQKERSLYEYDALGRMVKEIFYDDDQEGGWYEYYYD